MVTSPNGTVAATTPDGTFVWSFDPRSLRIAHPELVTGGPNLLAYGGGQVAVIDRTGTVLGRGAFIEQEGFDGYSELFPAPTGTSWAWTTGDMAPTDGTPSPAPQVSSLWVAGVGQPPRKVRTWTGDYSVRARQWSDAGIVVVKVTTTCGSYPHSSALVDPATGAQTPLFGDGRWPLDVAAGLSVATDVDERSLYVTGTAQIATSFPLLIKGAGIAPSSSRLFVSTFDEAGCGGQRKAATGVIEVPSGTQTTIDGFFAGAWLDDTHLLGWSLVTHPNGGADRDAHVRVSDLSGRQSDLVLGTLVGVMRPL